MLPTAWPLQPSPATRSSSFSLVRCKQSLLGTKTEIFFLIILALLNPDTLPEDRIWLFGFHPYFASTIPFQSSLKKAFRLWPWPATLQWKSLCTRAGLHNILRVESRIKGFALPLPVSMLPAYPLNWPYACVLSLLVYESTCSPTFLPIFRLDFLISFPKTQSGNLLQFPCPFAWFLVRGVW